MAFGATLTLVVNGGNVVLNRINDGSYGSEYLLVSSTEEYRVKIRHSKEAPSSLSTYGFDRHNLEVTHTLFATSTDPQKVQQAYVVLRNDYNDNKTNVGYINASLIDFCDVAGTLADLVNWLN